VDTGGTLTGCPERAGTAGRPAELELDKTATTGKGKLEDADKESTKEGTGKRREVGGGVDGSVSLMFSNYENDNEPKLELELALLYSPSSLSSLLLFSFDILAGESSSVSEPRSTLFAASLLRTGTGSFAIAL